MSEIDPEWTQRVLDGLLLKMVHVVEVPPPAERGRTTVVVELTPEFAAATIAGVDAGRDIDEIRLEWAEARLAEMKEQVEREQDHR